MTSVTQLMQAEIFRAGIKGDSGASDRKWPEESGGMKLERALYCFDLINHDRNTSVRQLTTLWVPLCSYEGRLNYRKVGRGGIPRFDVKMLTLSFVLVTCF